MDERFFDKNSERLYLDCDQQFCLESTEKLWCQAKLYRDQIQNTQCLHISLQFFTCIA